MVKKPLAETSKYMLYIADIISERKKGVQYEASFFYLFVLYFSHRKNSILSTKYPIFTAYASETTEYAGIIV